MGLDLSLKNYVHREVQDQIHHLDVINKLYHYLNTSRNKACIFQNYFNTQSSFVPLVMFYCWVLDPQSPCKDLALKLADFLSDTKHFLYSIT